MPVRKIVDILKSKKHESFLKSLDKQKQHQAQSILQRPEFQKIYSRLDSTFNIPTLPHDKKIWAIAMVKNEEDIVAQTIRHMFRQGVDAVLIVDNKSTDKTLDILNSLSTQYAVFVGTDAEPAYFQTEKMTWLADKVASAGAEWIVPFDADEFWYGLEGSLREILSNSSADVLLAKIYNQFPTLQGWGLDNKAHPDPKIAFRPSPPFVISMGNHDVVMAGGRDAESLVIIHVPWRSYEQFSRKLSQGASALATTNLPDEKGYHWRIWGKNSPEALSTQWELLLAGTADSTLAWRPLGQLLPTPEFPPESWENTVLYKRCD
ncbi:glycosyltransferase family 2 protein [Rothia terrae]|uniref:glycosyltransferase family 2 protein n=1 Tax=Rothia terrae TaxID=396015 RepID=UPI0028823994|nr:glycosyltransferase family 2 protein [Rothia terrae]MDT0190350.1 glycosyltransferase family 2 protein [Rothia terrae]